MFVVVLLCPYVGPAFWYYTNVLSTIFDRNESVLMGSCAFVQNIKCLCLYDMHWTHKT